MLAKVVHVEQGTEEWDALRRTRITVSKLADVCTNPRPVKDLWGNKQFDTYGNPLMEMPGRYHKYRTQKTRELMGHTEEEDNPEWFRHGREMEPRALLRYDHKYREKDGFDRIDHDCFLIHPEHTWLGCSPDGLAVTDGEYTAGMEVKGRKTYVNYRNVILRTRKYHDLGKPELMVKPENKHQIQGAMWVTGFDFWWYVNYYEDRDGSYRLGRCRIPRDQSLIDQMEIRCIEFITACYKDAMLTLPGKK